MSRCWVVLGFVGVVMGCVESSARRCGELVCSETAVCSPAGDRCVMQSQVDACTAATDGTGCSYPGVPEGVCGNGVCLGAGCGNGIVDPNSEELCDDGNRISLDGCRADCLSDERCGDGVTDLAADELCDCGDGNSSVPGCTMANSMAVGATCRPDCLPTRCGDGVIDLGETCDDHNMTAGDGCNSTCTGRWTQMYSGTFADLRDVWGSGPDDVFAVGYRKILHYDGIGWSAMPLAQPPANYVAVWGFGPSDIYALANNRLDHYDGTSWTVFHTLEPGRSAEHVWGSSTTDLWVSYSDGLEHYTQGSWSGFESFSDLNQLTGSAANSVIGVVDAGVNVNRYRLIRWTSGALSQWVPWTNSSSISIDDAIVAKFVHVLAPNDILAYDAEGAVPGMNHFDGTTWTRTECCDDVSSYPSDFGGVAGDLVMAGYMGRIFTSTTGYNWVPSPGPTTTHLSAVWSAGVNDAFIVGDGGMILH